MNYSSISSSGKRARVDKIENFDNKVRRAIDILSKLEISDTEKEIMQMSLESMSEFIENHYKAAKK